MTEARKAHPKGPGAGSLRLAPLKSWVEPSFKLKLGVFLLELSSFSDIIL